MKTSYLQSYLGDFTLVDSAISSQNIPTTWQKIFETKDSADRIQRIITVWSENYENKLSKLIDVFERYLIDVSLLNTNGELAILYEFEVDGESRYYLGKNPLQKNIPTAIAPFWNSLPADFKAFYDELHNGWYELETEAAGPAPVENFMILSAEEWGILEEIEIDFSLHNVMSVFSNGAGGYLCWNFNQTRPESLIWWHDEAPDEDVEFWDVLDEWTSMGIDEE